MVKELDYIKAYVKAEKEVTAAIKSLRFVTNNVELDDLSFEKFVIAIKSLELTTKLLDNELSKLLDKYNK